jgi:hypothetical protein
LKTTGHQKTELIRQQIIKSIQNKWVDIIHNRNNFSTVNIFDS